MARNPVSVNWSACPRSRFAFSMDANPQREIWTRHFPSRRMRSVLFADGDELVEKLGLFCLRFTLEPADGRLRMKLRRITAFGVPCPRWLFPDVFAEEHGEGQRFHFEIHMTMPFAGRVVRYRGYLDLTASEAAA